MPQNQKIYAADVLGHMTGTWKHWQYTKFRGRQQARDILTIPGCMRPFHAKDFERFQKLLCWDPALLALALFCICCPCCNVYMAFLPCHWPVVAHFHLISNTIFHLYLPFSMLNVIHQYHQQIKLVAIVFWKGSLLSLSPPACHELVDSLFQ